MKNIFRNLSKNEQEIILDFLKTAERVDVFEDWEFDSLFGISRKQLSDVREKWPNVSGADKNVCAAVIGSINNLLGYSGLKNDEWAKNIRINPSEAQLLLNKLIDIGV